MTAISRLFASILLGASPARARRALRALVPCAPPFAAMVSALGKVHESKQREPFVEYCSRNE